MDELEDDLHYAAGQGDVPTVKRLIDEKHDLQAFDDMGWTPLHHAADQEHLEVVRLLIQAGVDVNAHDESVIGNTPLCQVAGSCSLEMAQVLVAAGANPNIRGWMQLCALDKAQERQREEGGKVYRLLCEAARRFNRT